MIRVKDIMTTEVVSIPPEMEIAQATKLLLEKRINGLPVVASDGRLVGILCQSDLVAQQKQFPVPSLFTLLDGYLPLGSLKRLEREVEKIAATTVEQAMTWDPETVHPDMTIAEAAALMVDKGFHTLPVVDQGRLVGIVGKGDILRTLLPGEPRP